MINIVIVDDDKSAIKSMRKKIEQCDEFTNISFNIDEYDNPLLFTDKKIKEYDVYFLDIDMPMENGISLAKQIRKQNISAVIIFITNRTDLMHETFLVQPFYFIRKSNYKLDCQILFPLLKEQLKKIKKNIQLVVNGRKVIISLSNIIYIESFNHYVGIFLNNGENLSIKMKLSDILLKMGSDSIVQVHRSYLVNMLYIDYIKKNTLFLKVGKSIPIGRKYSNDLMEKYERYLLL